MPCAAIAFSAREAMIAGPKRGVAGTISVPGEAAARAAAAQIPVTAAVVLALAL